MRMNRPGPRRELAPVEVLTPLPAPQLFAYAAPQPYDESPGMLSLADHLLQHGRLFVGVIAAALVLGLLYLAMVPPVWQAETLVQIDGHGPRPLAASLSPTQRMGNDPAPLQGFVQGEIEILRSRDIVARAIAKTSADVDIAVANRAPLIGGWWARRFARGEGRPIAPPAPWLARWSWGGETLRLAAIRVPGPAFGEPLWLEAGEAGQWTLADDDDRPLARGSVGAAVPFTLDAQRAEIQVAALDALPGTRFRIVPNNPAVVHDRLMRSLRVEEAGRQSGVIRAILTDHDPHFAIAFLDAITAGYLDHHLKVSTGEASRALEFLDRQLPVVKRELDRAEEALNQYRAGNNTMNISQESESALRRLGELEKLRVEVDLKRQDLAQRYTPEYPGVAALDRQLGMLNAEGARLRAQMRQAPRQERDVVRLQRDVAVNTQLYTALLNNAQELRLSQAGMAGSARLVDAAGVLSQPVHPRPGTVLSLAGGLGLVAALAAVLLARALRPTLRTAEELERHSGRETIATVPESPLQRSLMRGPRLWRARLQQRLLAARAPADPAVEGLRALRNAVALREHDGRGGQTVLITAPTTAAGKSFVAANLAVLMAAANRRVLLVDMDLRAPRLQVYFGIPRDHAGIADVLAGRCELADAIIPDVLPGLDLLPAGRVVDNPGEMMLQPQLETVMDELRASHAQVLIDSAPVLPVGDTLALGRLADVTYLVVRSEANTRREIRDALRRLDGTGAQVEGLVLNGVNRHRLANVPYAGYFPPGGDAPRALPVVVPPAGA